MRFLPVLAGAVLCAMALPAAAQTAPGCTPRVANSELVTPGTLTLSTNPTLPPMQFVDSTGALRGMRVELGAEIAKRLCLKVENVRVEFAAMIPGLAARRWDMINTGMFFTEERARLMQLVRYEQQAISISVPRGNPRNIRSVNDLAGLSIGVEQGGFEFNRTQDIVRQVSAAGGRAPTVRAFDNFAVSFQALRVGQVEAAVSIDSTGKEYETRGDFARAISGLFPTPIAFGLRSRPLAEAVAKVLEEMRADGSYARLLEQYGVRGWDEAFSVTGPAP
jgi:polar amino acid transport system substrate-binding protein